jgi:hypothetical protein
VTASLRDLDHDGRSVGLNWDLGKKSLEFSSLQPGDSELFALLEKAATMPNLGVKDLV